MKRVILLLGIMFFLLEAPFLACAPKRVPVEKPLLPEALIQEGPSKEPWEVKWQENLREARKEGKIRIDAATAVVASREMLQKAAKEKFGLDLEMVLGRGNEVAQKVFTERKAGIYLADLYIGGITTTLNVLIPAGVLTPAEPLLILPEVTDNSKWLGGKLPFWESGKYSLMMSAQVVTHLDVNTSLVNPEEIKSYRDLLNPKWKNKIVMNDPSISGSGNLFFAMVSSIMGLEYMRELAKQEPMIIRDERLIADWLAQGKYAIALASLPDPIRNLKEAGAPVINLPPMIEGAYMTGGIAHLAIYDRPGHPNATKVFANWLLSREGQTHWVKSQGNPSFRLDVPNEGVYPSHGVPDPNRKYLMDDETANRERPKTYNLAREIFGLK